MVKETIQYYTEKGGRAVYLLLLDASKAFDKVSYEKLFELLLARNVCPKIVKLLYYMYHDGTKRPSSISYFKMTGQGGVFPFCISRMTVDYATVRSF